MITATNKGQSRELIPAGNYVARCYSMVEMGTITDSYMGEPKTQQKVMITWELPTELKVFNKEKGEQPLVISQEFTLSLNEKANLRKILESWRGKGFSEDEAKAFDISKLIGVPGLLNIIHKPKQNGEMKQTISTITPVPKGMTVPKQINKTVLLSYDNFDDDVFNSLPDFLKTKMKGSQEYQALMNPEQTTIDEINNDHIGDNDGSLPF